MRTTRIDDSNAELLRHGFERLIDELPGRLPCLAVVIDAGAVSVCQRARGGPHGCAEAGVDTLPEHRGWGYGTAVVAAWASAVCEAGGTPLYSTAWENQASRALARRLALIQYGEDLYFT